MARKEVKPRPCGCAPDDQRLACSAAERTSFTDTFTFADRDEKGCRHCPSRRHRSVWGRRRVSSWARGCVLSRGSPTDDHNDRPLQRPRPVPGSGSRPPVPPATAPAARGGPTPSPPTDAKVVGGPTDHKHHRPALDSPTKASFRRRSCPNYPNCPNNPTYHLRTPRSRPHSLQRWNK